MVRRKTVAQYSPLDIVSLFIFAGLVENSVTSLAGNIMPEAILSGACFIVLFHYWVSSTKLYMRIFPLSRYVLVKNGTIDRNAVAKAGISEDHLWIELRKADVINITQVKEASLEANGDFSVVKSESAKIDPVTGLEYSWSSAEDWSVKLLNSGSREITFVAIDFCNTGELNDRFGKEKVNKSLKEAADLCSSILRYDDRIFRFDEDRFFLVLNVGKEKRTDVVETIALKLNTISTLETYHSNMHLITFDLENSKGLNVAKIKSELEESIAQNNSKTLTGRIFLVDEGKSISAGILD